MQDSDRRSGNQAMRHAAVFFGSCVAIIAASQPGLGYTIMLPCPPSFAMPVHALVRIATPVHFKVHPVKRRHVHKHPAGKRGRMGMVALSRGLCPFWVGEGETNGSDLAGFYGHEFGGDNSESGGGFGGEEGASGGGGAGAGGSGGDFAPTPLILASDVQPIPLTPDSPPIVPPPDCCSPPPPIPSVPEPATWLLFATGFACVGFSAFRQRLATVSQWRR